MLLSHGELLLMGFSLQQIGVRSTLMFGACSAPNCRRRGEGEGVLMGEAETKGILAAESALAWWRYLRIAGEGPVDRGGFLRDRTATARSLLQCHAKPQVSRDDPIPSGCEYPLRLISCGDEGRMKSSAALTSRCSALCDRSVVDCEQGFLVLAPEMCFVSMAACLSLVETIVLGYEFCGTYVVRPGGETCYGKAPLCKKEKLVDFARKAEGAAGRRKALRALSFVSEGSASPMETVFVMMLCLPYRLGGFGFPTPELNYSIRTQNVLARKKAQRVRFADLCWPESRLICEYDSDEFHPDEKRGYDAARRNELRLAGYVVVEVDKSSVWLHDRFRALALSLARALGRRLRPPAGFDRAHVDLRLCLLGRRRNPLLL